jgi:spore maturation protein A
MDRVGMTAMLSRLLSPILGWLFPQSRRDAELAGLLSGNVTANLLGLGNAATPMGIRAAGRLRDPADPGRATDQLCRLVVMNTASIQLLPTTVAAVRQSAGCSSPFDILPCVWVSSILSVSAGLLAAWFLGRVWHD